MFLGSMNTGEVIAVEEGPPRRNNLVTERGLLSGPPMKLQ